MKLFRVYFYRDNNLTELHSMLVPAHAHHQVEFTWKLIFKAGGEEFFFASPRPVEDPAVLAVREQQLITRLRSIAAEGGVYGD